MTDEHKSGVDEFSKILKDAFNKLEGNTLDTLKSLRDMPSNTIKVDDNNLLISFGARLQE